MEFTPETMEARRTASQDRETKAAATGSEPALPPIPDIDLPTIFGDGPGGPHYVAFTAPNLEGDLIRHRYRLSSFTLRNLPLANRAFNALPGSVQTIIFAWSRMPIGGGLDVALAVNFVRTLTTEKDKDSITGESLAMLSQIGCAQMAEDEVDALIDFIHLSLSRYQTGLDREVLLDALDIDLAARIAGTILSINPGLSEAFFAPSGSPQSATGLPQETEASA